MCVIQATTKAGQALGSPARGGETSGRRGAPPPSDDEDDDASDEDRGRDLAAVEPVPTPLQPLPSSPSSFSDSDRDPPPRKKALDVRRRQTRKKRNSRSSSEEREKPAKPVESEDEDWNTTAKSRPARRSKARGEETRRSVDSPAARKQRRTLSREETRPKKPAGPPPTKASTGRGRTNTKLKVKSVQECPTTASSDSEIDVVNSDAPSKKQPTPPPPTFSKKPPWISAATQPKPSAVVAPRKGVATGSKGRAQHHMSSTSSDSDEEECKPETGGLGKKDESPPKLDTEGKAVQDKNKTRMVARLFRKKDDGGKGGKGGAKGGKGKGTPAIKVECRSERTLVEEDPLPMMSPDSVLLSHLPSHDTTRRGRSIEPPPPAPAPIPTPSPVRSRSPLRIMCRIDLNRIRCLPKKSSEIRTRTELPNTRQEIEESVPKSQVLSRLFDTKTEPSPAPTTPPLAPSVGPSKGKKRNHETEGAKEKSEKRKRSERERRPSASSVSSISTVSSRMSSTSTRPGGTEEERRHHRRSGRHRNHEQQEEEAVRKRRLIEEPPPSKLSSQVCFNFLLLYLIGLL